MSEIIDLWINQKIYEKINKFKNEGIKKWMN